MYSCKKENKKLETHNKYNFKFKKKKIYYKKKKKC